MNTESIYQNVSETGAAVGGADHETPPYLHGVLSRDQVKQLMAHNSNEEGCWLIRDKANGSFVLSVLQSGKPQHYVIGNSGGTYGIDDGPRYTSLDELASFYLHDPSSPTKLTTPICRPGTSWARWKDRKKRGSGGDGGGDAPALPPTTYRAGSGGNAPLQTALDLNADIYGNAKTVGLTPRPAEPEAPPAPAAPTQQYDMSQGSEFQNSSKYKKIVNAQQKVDDINFKARQRANFDGATGAASEMQERFEVEAEMTERLNTFWLNQKLKALGDDAEVTEPTECVKNGVLILRILELLSGKKTKYTKKPRMPVQMSDNWTAIVTFMRSLGIEVDGKPSDDPDEETTALNATALFELERREHLKLFSKIMFWENHPTVPK